MATYVAQPCGCTEEVWMGKKRRKVCEHRHLFEKVVKDGSATLQRGPSTLKPGRGLAASPAQRKKVKDQSCIACGVDRHEAKIEAAHVYPRRFAPCPCAEGVVPLCHNCHRSYDAGDLDLLPLLLAHGYRTELLHAVLIHEASPFHVLEQVTGVEWVPKGEVA